MMQPVLFCGKRPIPSGEWSICFTCNFYIQQMTATDEVNGEWSIRCACQFNKVHKIIDKLNQKLNH